MLNENCMHQLQTVATSIIGGGGILLP